MSPPKWYQSSHYGGAGGAVGRRRPARAGSREHVSIFWGPAAQAGLRRPGRAGPISGWEAAVAVPAADGSHTEKRKMTVSERSIPALTAALRDWLGGRLAPLHPV